MAGSSTTMDGFWKEMLKGLGEVSRQHFDQYVDLAEESATQFLTESREDVERYIKLHADNKLSKDDCTWLLNARLVDLSRMHALTELGIAQIKLEHYRIAIVDKLVELVFRFVDILINSVVDKLGGKSLTTPQP